MKSFKFVSRVAVIPAAACCLALAACSGYAPAAGEHYYEYDGAYRVISLSDEEPVTEKNVPLAGISLYFFLYDDTFDLTVTGGISSGDILFDGEIGKVTVEGVKAIYDCLGIQNSELNDGVTFMEYTGFAGYTQKKEQSSMTATITKPADSGDYDAVAYVGDVTVYKFDYEDRSKSNGEVLSGGTFCAYYCNSVSIDIVDFSV